MTMTKERRRPAYLSGVSMLAVGLQASTLQTLLIEQIYCGKKDKLGR